MKRNSRRYSIERRNKFFEANRHLVEHEISPGNTVSFVRTVDLTVIEKIRSSEKAAGQNASSYTAFVVKALAASLTEFPYANRRVCRRIWWPIGCRLQKFHHCDIAVACERTISGAECVAFADVLRDSDKLTLQQCNQWLKQLSTADVTNNRQWRAFSNVVSRLPPWLARWLLLAPNYVPGFWDRYRGAAAIVSSPAKYGVRAVLGSWAWPIGISFGLVHKVPMVKDDEVVARPAFELSMNFDRRVMAGAQAAKFFSRIVEHLETPANISPHGKPSV